MKSIFTPLVFITLTLPVIVGCATQSSVQRASDYEICRLSILRPPLQSSEAIAEADRQISVRGVKCERYAGTILQRREEGLRQMQQSIESITNQRYPSGSPLQQRSPSITCFKTREWISGSLKNCAYNCQGSEAVTTISAAQVCPISINR